MTLTGADVSRLEAAGFTRFTEQRPNGDIQLKNHDGGCIFLDGGRCEVYEVRPEGCRLYPLILDLGLNRVVRDKVCPHREEFSMDPDRIDRLRRSVAREGDEARKRLGRVDD